MTMKPHSLIQLLMSRFAIYMVALLLLSAPIFYFIVTGFYTEDLTEAAQLAGIPPSEFDLEEDTIIGLVFQILSIVVILAVAIFLIMRLVPAKLWQPFYQTMHVLERFRVEAGQAPRFDNTAVKEFAELNDTLTRILSQSVRSYQVQKQFTENASHELQTPLAIIQSKLDLLLQDTDLTDRQAQLIETIYHEAHHMSQLNRNLLLLARIENAQYQRTDRTDLAAKLSALLPSLQLLAGSITIHMQTENSGQLLLDCNEVLLESMLNNLVVNAVRHNRPDGEIVIELHGHELLVSNTSNEPPLDATRLFERFHQTAHQRKGNGLGLAIVKSICDYHEWTISYTHKDAHHQFRVVFPQKALNRSSHSPLP